jgi:hypothetical protein
MSASVVDPSGLPTILDLTSGRPRRRRNGLAEIVYVSTAQLDEALLDLERVPELPEAPGRTLVQFVPFGAGYLGIPFCTPLDDGFTCWPMKGGPDDNPLAFVCVCRPSTSRPPTPPCYMDYRLAPFRLNCVRGTCRGECQPAVAVQKVSQLQTFSVGCACDEY